MKEKVVWVGLVIVVCLCQWGYNKGVQGQEKLDTIYVVFSNHLDVGFDGISPQIGYAFNVINEYFRVYFPRFECFYFDIMLSQRMIFLINKS